MATKDVHLTENLGMNKLSILIKKIMKKVRSYRSHLLANIFLYSQTNKMHIIMNLVLQKIITKEFIR
jgi:hypothetical protein